MVLKIIYIVKVLMCHYDISCFHFPLLEQIIELHQVKRLCKSL